MTQRFVKARFMHPIAPWQAPPLLTLEMAHTAAQRAAGLMGRAMLAPHHGMLFVFPTEELWGFWMKNTGIPLDLAWLSPAGVVLETAQLFPHDELLRVPKQVSKYAIELPAGALASYSVHVGDQLVLVGP